MIGLRAGGRCAEHRAALVEFAARRARGPAIVRALDHVDRCRACEEALATTTLVLHGLRRLHQEIERAEPSADAWARLRARLAARRREPSRLLSGLPGIVVAAGLCAAVVGPGVIGGGDPARVYNEAPRAETPPSLLFEQGRERAREAGVLAEPDAALPYTGVGIAPPPITADLPPSAGRQTRWPDDTEETRALAPASVGREDSPAAPGRQEVTHSRS
ncbi:MAG TPA: hypothetical protein VLM76_06510 [Patescibacteria group bacterium]|nr:hypothetical protein [Patescibacteria group bacterium]